MNSRDKAANKKSRPSTSTTTTRSGKTPASNNNITNKDRRLAGASTAASASRSSSSSSSTTTTSTTRPSSSKSASKTSPGNNKSQTTTGRPHGRFMSNKKSQFIRELSKDSDDASNSSEMAQSTSLLNEHNLTEDLRSNVVEQETNLDTEYRESQDTDCDESFTLLEAHPPPKETTKLLSGDGAEISRQNDAECLPEGWEQHTDKIGSYFWHVATGFIQRTRPTADFVPRKDSLVLYHDDEEINQGSTVQKTSSDEDEFFESGAALTIAEDTFNDNSITFVVYPLGSCEFDETQLVSTTNTKAIQRCILRLANRPTKEESMCWGFDQSEPLLMKLVDNLIQFTDLKTQTLIRSQPIPTIKTWAVDDDNNFAFVVEERTRDYDQASLSNQGDPYDSMDHALLNAPSIMCYVFTSMDDDDMSCRVATKVNEEMQKYKEQIADKMRKSTRLQQMVEPVANEDNTDADDDLDDLEESNEMTISVKFIGKVQVSKPTGVDTLNYAIDKSLADASKAQLSRMTTPGATNIASAAGSTSIDGDGGIKELKYGDGSPLIDAKLHVSPSSVIVENEATGEIIVECRIRYLTFIGISQRDIRWCAFIMQNTTNKSFVAHCFEVSPTSAKVCDAIQLSCMRLYEKVLKNQQRQADATSIIPKSSKIRDTLTKTLSRIIL